MNTKEVAYKTLVRPQLEYTAPIWHPHHETQIAQVEKLPGGSVGDGEIQEVYAICWTNLSGYPLMPVGSNPP